MFATKLLKLSGKLVLRRVPNEKPQQRTLTVWFLLFSCYAAQCYRLIGAFLAHTEHRNCMDPTLGEGLTTASDDDLPIFQKKWNLTDKEEQERNWAQAPITLGDDTLEIMGLQVMQKWEAPLMEELAQCVTQKGGRILEIGYGMGISANAIQKYPIEEHVIIEANLQVFEKLVEFSKTSPQKVTPILGFWQNVMPTLEKESFQGILFDDYPISSLQWEDRKNTTIFKDSFALLKKGGILTYYSEKIRELPWSQILCKDVGVLPPTDCEYWRSETMLSPVLIK